MSEKSPISKEFHGFLLPPDFSDIFLVTYPKSGTTCMQVILHALMHNGDAFDENITEYFACTPFIGQIGAQGLDQMRHP